MSGFASALAAIILLHFVASNAANAACTTGEPCVPSCALCS